MQIERVRRPVVELGCLFMVGDPFTLLGPAQGMSATGSVRRKGFYTGLIPGMHFE
jgi:hypothetical protein